MGVLPTPPPPPTEPPALLTLFGVRNPALPFQFAPPPPPPPPLLLFPPLGVCAKERCMFAAAAAFMAAASDVENAQAKIRRAWFCCSLKRRPAPPCAAIATEASVERGGGVE
jgi:hypothetical protein